MSDFDNWKEEQERIHNDYDAENAWYAGQQSQQARIDAITKQRDSFIKAHHIAINDVCEHKAKIDELQKRIDEAVEHIEDYYGVVGLSMIVDILRGDKS